MRGNNNENGAIHCTARTSATPNFKAVSGAIGREHQYGAESVSKTGLKNGSDSQEESSDSKTTIGLILGVMIPDSLENNSYIDEIVVYLKFGLLDQAIECIEEAIVMSDETHTFQAMLKQVLSLKNNQLNLFKHKKGAAGHNTPAPRL